MYDKRLIVIPFNHASKAAGNRGSNEQSNNKTLAASSGL